MSSRTSVITCRPSSAGARAITRKYFQSDWSPLPSQDLFHQQNGRLCSASGMCSGDALNRKRPLELISQPVGFNQLLIIPSSCCLRRGIISLIWDLPRAQCRVLEFTFVIGTADKPRVLEKRRRNVNSRPPERIS